MISVQSNIMVTVNDLKVSYTDEGPVEAPVIIFIHGFPLNKSMWEMQFEALAEDYRVIAYDIRGHGDSDAGSDYFTIELFVKDLLSFMDDLKISKAVICGLSMGGYIALNAIVNYPGRFDAVILCDTSCMADTHDTKDKRLLAIENIKKNGLEDFADQNIKSLFAVENLKSCEVEIALVKEMIVETSNQSIYNTLHALALRKETCSRLAEIKKPVLILVGNEDTITPPSMARFMHDHIRNSSLKIINNAGHLSNLENPYEFNYQVIKFVSTLY